jgi:hypothetical protein
MTYSNFSNIESILLEKILYFYQSITQVSINIRIYEQYSKVIHQYVKKLHNNLLLYKLH